jgi:hypothetical protein
MAREINIPNAKAGALEQWIEGPQKFMRDMLEHEKLFHRGSSSVIVVM